MSSENDQIVKALEHVASSDHMMYGAYYTARSDGGKSIKLLKKMGITESDIFAYTRIKLGGTSSSRDKRREDRLIKKLAKLGI
jgi:hypothetical protein